MNCGGRLTSWRQIAAQLYQTRNCLNEIGFNSSPMGEMQNS
jgi:hypothetical protein